MLRDNAQFLEGIMRRVESGLVIAVTAPDRKERKIRLQS
jgi:hypothetical protein